MLRKIKNATGKAAFWISWPILYWYLHKTERTRVLIVWEGKILVVKPWLGSGKWSLPGGGLHNGEDIVEGAAREVYEETGIVVHPKQLVHIGSVDGNEYGFRFVCHQLTVELKECPDIRLDGREIQSSAWLSIEHVSDENIDQTVQSMCSNWQQSAQFAKL